MRDHLHFKDHTTEARLFGRRALLTLCLLALLMGGLVVRYYNLQVTHHQDYVTQSDRNRIHVQPVPPTRGLIYDRNGQLLAENRASYTLSIIGERVDDLEQTLAQLAELVTVSETDLEKFYQNLAQRRRPFEAVPLRYLLTEDEIARIAVNEYRLEGVEVEAQLVRHYPYQELFAHVVGYVGRVNERELAGFDEEEYEQYRGTYTIGKTGLEKQYEKLLLGRVGYQHVESDARGRIQKELERSNPQPGEDLHLYLDLQVQRAAMQALEGRRGAVVALDVRTGGVVALVSNPGFDPNLFVTGISVADYLALRDSPDVPLFDRAIRGQYPPGSTLKPMLGLGGLAYGTITPDTTINDRGFFKLPGEERRYRDHISWGHGEAVDLYQAIVESCNTFYYELAHRMTIDKIHPFGTRFGLGQKTGIDLPGERTGLWPSRQWKREARGEVWYPGDNLNVGVGQGFVLLTPIQMALMTATLANEGEKRQPRLVRIDQATTTTAGVPLPTPVETIDIKSEHWDYVHHAMTQVIHSNVGTARRISKQLDYQIAGKTGTAQVVGIAQDAEYDAELIDERQRDQALFVGFAPADDPQLAVAVLVENSGHGGEQSAPVARQVFDAYFASEAQRQVTLNNGGDEE